MYQDCSECQRLWDEYGSAIRAHVQIDNKLRIAALRHHGEEIKVLTPRYEDAEAARNRLREAIKRHEESAHGQAAG
jgi:hypothetical protein